jgi:hypothetical protein
MCPEICGNSSINSDDIDSETITRMIVLGSKSELNTNKLVNYISLLDLPVTIKITDYGVMINGKEKDVLKTVKEVRKLDPNNIFTRERGFPIWDRLRCKEHIFGLKPLSREIDNSKRCNGHRFGPREGFHQADSEYKLLEHVSDALRNPKEVSLEVKKQMNVDELEKIFKEN